MHVYGTQRQNEKRSASKRRVYGGMRTVATAVTKPGEVCIMHLQPAICYSLQWDNVPKVNCLMEPVYHFSCTLWFTTSNPQICDGIKFGWRSRNTFRSAGCRTPYCIDSQNAEWDRWFWNWPAHGLIGYKERTRDVYQRRGSCVPFSNCGRDRDIRWSCVLWGVWVFMWWLNLGLDYTDFMLRMR
jgi:hypothetical protein